MSTESCTVRNANVGDAVKVSVITATYNRVHTLPRTYEALKRQTFRDFEWVIVDDGSSDGTELLVRGWQAEGMIRILYLWEPNGGVNTARNAAVRQARGEMIVKLDSDDWCEPDGLEKLMEAWEDIPSDVRESFSGVSCLSKTADGELIGNKFPNDIMDAYPYEVQWHYHVIGDKWQMQRRDLMLQYPFPVFAGEKFCPEALVWNRIGKRYKKRFINQALEIVDAKGGDRLSGSAIMNRAANPRAWATYHAEVTQLPIGLRWRLAAACLLGCSAAWHTQRKKVGNHIGVHSSTANAWICSGHAGRRHSLVLSRSRTMDGEKQVATAIRDQCEKAMELDRSFLKVLEDRMTQFREALLYE